MRRNWLLETGVLLILILLLTVLFGCNSINFKPKNLDEGMSNMYKIEEAPDVSDLTYIESQLLEWGSSLESVREKTGSTGENVTLLTAEEAISRFVEEKDAFLERLNFEKPQPHLSVAFIPSEGWYFISIYNSGMLSGYEFLIDGHTGNELFGWQTE